MVRKTKTIDEIKEDLKILEEKIREGLLHSVILYVPEDIKNRKKMVYLITLGEELPEDILEDLEDEVPGDYELVLFKDIPLHVKIEVIENGITLFSKDELELKEYFYEIRKLWGDQKERQELEPEEVITMIKRGGIKIDKKKVKKKMEELTSQV